VGLLLDHPATKGWIIAINAFVLDAICAGPRAGGLEMDDDGAVPNH
jgi:hypothetical protein